jgi:hypothetical protein
MLAWRQPRIQTTFQEATAAAPAAPGGDASTKLGNPLLDGRRLWVVHCDLADGVIRHTRGLVCVGDRAYNVALWLHRHFDALRARRGFDDWSLSQHPKSEVENAVASIGRFEQVPMREARRRGFDGVACGRIDHAEIRESDGLVDCNGGDRVNRLTAIVQTDAGELRVVRWDRILAPGQPVPRWHEVEGGGGVRDGAPDGEAIPLAAALRR